MKDQFQSATAFFILRPFQARARPPNKNLVSGHIVFNADLEAKEKKEEEPKHPLQKTKKVNHPMEAGGTKEEKAKNPLEKEKGDKKNPKEEEVEDNMHHSLLAAKLGMDEGKLQEQALVTFEADAPGCLDNARALDNQLAAQGLVR